MDFQWIYRKKNKTDMKQTKQMGISGYVRNVLDKLTGIRQI